MKYSIVLVFVFITFSSCHTTKNVAGSHDDGKIEMKIIQINDVYEISALNGGKAGGLARIATLKKQLLKENPNTFLIMAGDFLSPSVYNSLQYNGKAIRGKQMIETLNAAGLDLAVFGNHEFDIKESELTERIKESVFQWVSTNSFHKTGDKVLPFRKSDGSFIPETYILNLSDADGTKAKIGFIGICLPFNKADYVQYTDQLQSAKNAFASLKDSVDAVVAVTHQSMEDDELLAREIPGLAAIIGGHEHDQRFEKIGKLYITKAMANAKSAYILDFKINKRKSKVKSKTELKEINQSIVFDPATNSVVEKWTRIAEENYSSLGFDARKVVIKKGDPLDGRESEIRSHPTNLTRLITSALKDAVPEADVVLMNAGSIRVDDILEMPLTQYDIIRSLPFGGGIREAEMKGSLLIKILEQGKKNTGIGGYLLYNDNLKYENENWVLDGKVIESNQVYHAAITDFLFTGKEANFDFLNPSNPDIIKTYKAETAISNPKSDIRLVLIKYLEKLESRQ